jgi:hypothetical protein
MMQTLSLVNKLHIFKMDQKGKMMANFVHIGKNTTMILWIERKLVTGNTTIHLMFVALLASFKLSKKLYKQ